MAESLTPWAWVRRALAVAVLLTLAGWAVALVGVFTRPWVGMIGGVLVLFVGGFWGAGRIGGAAAGAALIGLLAAVGMSTEARHVWVARQATIVELPGLSAWDPAGGAQALHVGDLRHLRRHETWASERLGMGKNAHTVTQVATPLFDARENRVVGFHCRSGQDQHRSRDGGWVLSLAAMSGVSQAPCRAGTRRAAEACVKAGLVVEEGARQRVVEVFRSEQDLRRSNNLGPAFGVPLGFLFLYTVLVVVFRQRGVDGMD